MKGPTWKLQSNYHQLNSCKWNDEEKDMSVTWWKPREGEFLMDTEQMLSGDLTSWPSFALFPQQAVYHLATRRAQGCRSLMYNGFKWRAVWFGMIPLHITGMIFPAFLSCLREGCRDSHHTSINATNTSTSLLLSEELTRPMLVTYLWWGRFHRSAWGKQKINGSLWTDRTALCKALLTGMLNTRFCYCCLLCHLQSESGPSDI